MDNIEQLGFVQTLLDIGEELLLSGAEISRVEDTISRIGTACGAVQINVFVITSCIILTLTDKNGNSQTQTKRVRRPAGTDFKRLEKLNRISRACCCGSMSLGEMKEEISALRMKRSNPADSYRNYVGSALVGVGLTVFFGGNLMDGTAGAIGGILVCFLQERLEKYCPNRSVFNLISGFIVGLAICLSVRMMPFLHGDKIMIGDIMLQIPGIAVTISLRDIIVGETISGVLRLIESLMWAGFLACGFMLAIWMIL